MEEIVTTKIPGTHRAPQSTLVNDPQHASLSRRNLLFSGSSLATVSVLGASFERAQAQQQPAEPTGRRPNILVIFILVIFGDDIGQSNISAYTFGLMGYRTPNIDRLAREGMVFTDYYAEQSCTAGRSSFITGQVSCALAYPRSESPQQRRVCRQGTSH